MTEMTITGTCELITVDKAEYDRLKVLETLVRKFQEALDDLAVETYGAIDEAGTERYNAAADAYAVAAEGVEEWK